MVFGSIDILIIVILAVQEHRIPFHFLKDFIDLFMKDTEKETETQAEAEGEAGSMQGTQRGT